MEVAHDDGSQSRRSGGAIGAARAIGLFRYGLIRRAADPAHSTRARGRLVRAVAVGGPLRAGHAGGSHTATPRRSTMTGWAGGWSGCSMPTGPACSAS